MHTRWRWPAHQYQIHLAASPWMPSGLTFSISLSCGTLSNAFWSLDRQDLLFYCCPCHMCLWLWQRKSSRLIRQLCLFRKLCWVSPIRLFISKIVISLPLTNLSMVLQTIEVRLMGLYFIGSCLLPFLWIAVTFADFPYSGIIPVSTKLFKMCVRSLASLSSNARRIWGWSISDPVDLYMLKCCSFFCSSSVLKLKVSRILPSYWPNCGTLFSCSMVNTELKQLFIVLAKSL